MFTADGVRRVFPLPLGVTTIGRKDDCGIRIPVPEVSRTHAEIFVDEDGPVLRDLGAANGTFLNDKRSTEEDLDPGDQITIGPVVFTVQIDGDPEEAEIIEIRTKLRRPGEVEQPSTQVRASQHVSVSDGDIDPIAALEALASSTDQTAIEPDDE